MLGTKEKADLRFGLDSVADKSVVFELETPNGSSGKVRLLTGKPSSRTSTHH